MKNLKFLVEYALIRVILAFFGLWPYERGKELSGNGDYGVTGVVGPDFAVESHKGKPMSSFCPSFFATDQFILIPFYASEFTFDWIAYFLSRWSFLEGDGSAKGPAQSHGCYRRRGLPRAVVAWHGLIVGVVVGPLHPPGHPLRLLG